MRRLERAVVVRDVVMSYPPEKWDWDETGGTPWKRLATKHWIASLSTPFSRPSAPPRPMSYEQAALRQRALSRMLLYTLDLWVPCGGKVLSLEWGEHEARLISMRRGAWESDLFGLQPYEPRRTAQTLVQVAMYRLSADTADELVDR